MPALSGEIAAELDRLIDFGVRERLMLALIPAESTEDAEILGNLLLIIPAEAVFNGTEVGMLSDLRRWIGAVAIGVHGFAIRSHVCMVDEAEDAGDALAPRNQRVTQLEFHVLAAGAREGPVKIDAVCDRGHG